MRISIEKNGKQVYVGDIVGGAFCYAGEYTQREDAAPISISMPLQAEPFSPAQTRNFFDGLLPEGFTRRTLAKSVHIGEDDYLSLLALLGSECLGAIQVTDEHAVPTKESYDLLDDAQVHALAREGATKSVELVTKAHLSLTGASGKVGLYLNESDGSWYLPRGSAPSTHIVKQSHVRLDRIVTNEQLCLLTAKKMGVDTAESFIINTGEAAEGDLLLATRRYDRVIPPDSRMISGLPVPLRLHQEDFAQALGIAAADKYEEPGGEYLRKAFALLRNYSSDPIRDQQKLWDLFVFNYLIGNTDNHIKNLSLLYSRDLRGIRLAPAYDIVSTAVYESSTRNMAVAIGGKLSLDDISRDSFADAAAEAGLGVRMAVGRFDALCSGFEKALRESAAELDSAGFPGTDELAGQILQEGGIAHSR